MKRFILKIISVIVVLCFCTPLTSVYGLTDIMYADSNTEFALETARIVEKYDSEAQNTQVNSVGLLLRIIGKLSDESFDFSSFGASECIINKDGRFVLQFKNEASLKRCLDSLKNNSSVLYAEQDRLVCVNSEETKTDIGYSWGVVALGLDGYSEHLAYASDESSVTVAVVDSGVAKIDYVKEKLVSGYDFVDNDSDGANDTSVDSHGTFLASIISECTQNVPVNIMPVRVLKSKTGSLVNAVNGIFYAVDNGADVVNVSLGGIINNCKAFDDAVTYADNNNVSVVVCSGNAQCDTANYCPAHNEKAITVSSVNESLVFSSSFSNYGKEVDVCAPGVNISGYSADGTQKTMSGTSMSAAFISAGAALVRLQYPECNASQVQDLIKKSCIDLGETGFDWYYGHGIPVFDSFIINEPVHVEDLVFSETDVVMKVGETKSVDFTVYPPNATDSSVCWTSENNEIATVDELGVITAKKSGTTVISAETNDGGYKDSINVIVVTEPETPPTVTGISVAETPTRKTYTYKSNAKIDLSGIKLRVLYSDGTEETVTDPKLIAADGFDTMSVGKKTVTLRHAGFETEISVSVEYAWWQWIIRIMLLGFLWY